MPNLLVILNHLKWLIASVEEHKSNARFEIAWGRPNVGPNCAKTFSIAEVDAASHFAVNINKLGHNVYVGVTMKSPVTPSEGRTNTSHAVLAVCLPIDIDGDFREGLNKLKKVVKPQLIVMTGTIPEPRGQAWLRIAPTSNMELWKEVNHRSVNFCGGDKNALGTYRLMRLAGTISYPSPAKAERGYVQELTAADYYDSPIYKLEELLDLFPQYDCRQSDTMKHISRYNIRSNSIPLNKVNVAIIQMFLDALPGNYASEYLLWILVGFALHDFDRGEIGLALFEKFSKRCPDKAEKTDFMKVWYSFRSDYSGRKITLGSLIHHARQYDCLLPTKWDRSHDIRKPYEELVS